MLTTLLLDFLVAWVMQLIDEAALWVLMAWGVIWKQNNYTGQLDLGLSYVPLQGLWCISKDPGFLKVDFPTLLLFAHPTVPEPLLVFFLCASPEEN